MNRDAMNRTCLWQARSQTPENCQVQAKKPNDAKGLSCAHSKVQSTHGYTCVYRFFNKQIYNIILLNIIFLIWFN